ncbi:hypothetical protein Poli38472_002820 [Pythium oligandrum]|uniref:Uncharacterized protein n=1 Tax=Pythium oligandrum TaxID=41045 RepID=A0A8K1FB48_PYTOL|nr:hypothetical protein Poli38472_002820 [Pythium oligandrum]|eukprot:TMW56895.1 hypothetical protein Poli38472_002820 [Pythium oligandrum]
MSNAADEELWNLLVLQNEAITARLREFHQQVVTYIHLTGEDPLTGNKERVPDENISLRERSAAQLSTPLISEAMAKWTRELCDPHGCVRDAQSMTAFTKRMTDNALTLEDKMQFIFILDLTFTKIRTAAQGATPSSSSLSSVFEKERGYEYLSDWFAGSCTYLDDANKSFSKLVLQFFLQHKPTMAYARKMVLQKLRQLQTYAVGRQAKAMIKETVEKYVS